MRAFLSPSDAFQSPTVGEQWDGSLFHEGGPGHIFTVLDNLVDFSEGLDTDCVKAQFLSYTADSRVPGQSVSSSCAASCTNWKW